MMIRPGSRQPGLTLIEVVLSIGLMGLILAMLFVFTETTMKSDAIGRELATRSQLARVVLDRIAEEVRQAASFGTSIAGDRNSIRILSTVLPDRDIFLRRKLDERPRSAEYDLREIRYYLKVYEDEYVELEDGLEVPMVAGLYRREWKVLGHEGSRSPAQGMSALPQAVKITIGYKEIELEPIQELDEDNVVDLNPGVEEPFAPEIKCLKFAYSDGKNWMHTWAFREDELEEDEEAEIEAEMIIQDEDEEEDEEYHPDRYTVVVRLYQSDPTGLGSKIVRISDELREQFGGLTGGGGLGDLAGLGDLGGLGDLSNIPGLGGAGVGDLSNLAGNAGDLNKLKEQMGNLQNQLGGR